MIRRPPRSTRTDTLFPTRRSSDLPLEPRRLLARQPQITGGIFPLAQGARILARYPGEHDERFQIIARDARVIMIVRPQIELVVGDAVIRSEEHTSELQSLMRISYAVFCLKKKTHKRRKSTSQ